MNARDELAGIIEREYVRAVDRKRIGDVYTAPADAIVAAGYRKSRVITTTEGLDALPTRSAILSANGAVWVNDGDTEDPWASLAEDFHGGPIWTSSEYIDLPATVLHEGNQQ